MGQAGPVITTHSGALAAAFGRSPVTFSHDLPTAGMFSLDVLGDLSLRMELRAIEIGVLASPTDGTMVSRVPDVPVRDMIMSIPVGSSWVVLKDVQADEHYEAPVGALLGELEDLVSPVAQGFAARRGHVFIASEGAVTPTHSDDDEGLLLQIHGRKEVTLYDMGRSYFSPRLAREREGSARVFAAPQKVAEEVVTVVLEPGDGLYIPWRWPHSAKVLSPDFSVSLTVSVETSDTRSRSFAALTNDVLTRWGLRPRALGRHPRIDRVKTKVGTVLAHMTRQSG